MRCVYIIIFLFFSSFVSAEDALTIKQQLDRIVGEIEDLNKAVFNKSFTGIKNEDIQRFQAIDIRIYDLEKDIKNLTLQFEEIIFKLDDLSNSINRNNTEEDISLKLKELETRIILLE